jgi:hypothetical protein
VEAPSTEYRTGPSIQGRSGDILAGRKLKTEILDKKETVEVEDPIMLYLGCVFSCEMHTLA